MPIVDQLITEYVLSDKYTDKAKRIAEETDKLSRKIDTASNALLASGVAMSAFGTGSIKASGNMERELKALEALTGSAEGAQKAFRYLDDRAGKSIFNLTELVEGGKLMTAFGLDTQKYLPLADDLAAGLNKRLEDTVTVFGRLKSGDFGEAFERLRDFGISRSLLEAQGLKFDKGGQYIGSVETAMNGVEAIIKKRFNGLSQKLATETFSGATSNLGDAWERFERKIGDTQLPVATGALRELTSLIDKLRESLTPTQALLFAISGPILGLAGGALKAAAAWRLYGVAMKTATALQATTTAQVAATTVALNAQAGAATVAAGRWGALGGLLQKIPAWAGRALGALAIEGLGEAASSALGSDTAGGMAVKPFQRMGEAAALGGRHPIILLIAGLVGIIEEGIGAFGAQNAAAKALAATTKELEALDKKLISGGKAAVRDYFGGSSPRDELLKKQGRVFDAAGISAEVTKQMKTPADPRLPFNSAAGSGGFFRDNEGNIIKPVLDRIADHTEQMAQALDFRRFALGGGLLGQTGVTPVEFARFRRGGQEVVHRFEGNSSLEKAIAEIVNHSLRAHRRSGGF